MPVFFSTFSLSFPSIEFITTKQFFYISASESGRAFRKYLSPNDGNF